MPWYDHAFAWGFPVFLIALTFWICAQFPGHQSPSCGAGPRDLVQCPHDP